VRAWAPAKVNLFLEALGRRADGYHDLATLMVAVSLYDTLDFREVSGSSRAGEVRLECDWPELSTGPDNLVYRAAELVRRVAGVKVGAHITLRKRIPLAAGLAGGSSDAAATLAGLNRLWRLGWGPAELARLGAELGSDVPFFFFTPAAWCTGRGEVVQPLPLGKPLDLVLTGPPVGLATKDVVRALTVPSVPRDGAEMCRAVQAGDLPEVGRLLFNRLQAPAEGLCPAVARLHARLADLGPLGALMSGSGSTVFALCRGPAQAQSIARALRSQREDGGLARVSVVRSCD